MKHHRVQFIIEEDEATELRVFITSSVVRRARSETHYWINYQMATGEEGECKTRDADHFEAARNAFRNKQPVTIRIETLFDVQHLSDIRT